MLIVDIVKSYVGCSLSEDAELLGEFLSCDGLDDPKQIVNVKTNCGTFSRAVLYAAGIKHPILQKPYVIGNAIADLLTIGRDLKILRTDKSPVEGACMLYHSTGNDWHAEWCLSQPDSMHVALHGGGGRPNNLISMSTGDIRFNSCKPLNCWLDVASVI